jgi:UDP-N-acetylmuramoyl-L-alanyl-D-glutamate--2,6-diaminopimelate ligase
VGPIIYRYPSRKIRIVAITGTKGKSSTVEYVNAILEKAGYKTAVASTVRFKIGADTHANTKKMTMPGRFFLHSFLRKAVDASCDWAVIEMTSEGAVQKRHIGIALDALIFTNLAPEHIESHGSYANYVAAKLSIGKELERSPKRPRIMIANADDEYGPDFLALAVEQAVPYSLSQVQPWHSDENGGSMTYEGTEIHSQLPGDFTLKNFLAAAQFARAIGIDVPTIRAGLEQISKVPGRLERIEAGQSFIVVVDNAHTIDSQKALYRAFAKTHPICVLGSCGGGRDKWVRPEKGKAAEDACAQVILTDEDPYDENPEAIVHDIQDGMHTTPEVIMDRRLAIRRALSLAHNGKGGSVLIVGKGTDPCIMRAHGTREPWSDADIAREELERLLGKGGTISK